jgi:putative ABC transport system permease protein
VLWNQLEFMRSKDLGFNKEQVLAIPIGSVEDGAKTLKLLRNELANKPDILNISASSNILGYGRDESSSTSTTGFEHQGREVKTHILMVDYDYPETLDMELVAGRTFNRNYATDTLSVVINEAMAQQFTEENPLDIVMDLDESSKYKVIGVLKDFNFQNIDKNIEPLSLFMNQGNRVRYAYVRVIPGNLKQSYEQVEKAWNIVEPDREFLGSYLDENIDRTLRKERKMSTMISSGSILAIILSCIGLFAISLLMVAQRRKEIGIRKVVGASVRSITILLTKDFLKLVCIAFVIATPIAWWAATQWLQNYTYRIDLSIWTFTAAGFIAIVIAAITIGTRTIGAALANPVDSLKTE